MGTVLKYRIYCNTENQYFFVIKEEEDGLPTKCPNHQGHSIDLTKTVIYSEISQNTIKIKEESVSTNGNFTTETVAFNIPANSTVYEDSSWKYPISVYSVSFISKANQEGDVISISSNPDVVIGVITKPVNTNETVISVNSTVLDNIQPGFSVRLSNGNNYDELGEVYKVDKVNGTITVDHPPSRNYSHSTPTQVLIESYFVKNYEIGPPWKYDIGMSKIGAAYVPANTVIRTLYKNNSNEEKRFIGYIEYTH